jgi:hypothetical protein
VGSGTRPTQTKFKKKKTFQGDYAQFSFNKCPIYTHDGASAKFSTNLHVTDNSLPAVKNLEETGGGGSTPCGFNLTWLTAGRMAGTDGSRNV